MGPSNTGHPEATGQTERSRLRDDVAVVRDRGRDKLERLAATAPMYVPSRRPVGRTLRVASGLRHQDALSKIERREVLPERRVDRGTQPPIDVPPLHAFSIEPAKLVTDGSLFRGVITHDDVLMSEVSADHRSSAGDWTSFLRLQRYPRAVRTGSVISLLTGAGGANNFGHWLYDVLPRIHLVEQAGFRRAGDRFLVPPLDREFKLVTLAMLGIEPDDCVQIDGPALVEAERLAVSAGHRNHGRIEPWIPRFLRDRLMSDSIPQTGRRLYVNRRDTKIRRILNEDRLESALAVRGFESVSMADFDLREKLHLYASAEFIVAPHGSGLAGLAFCAPGTRVIEIAGGDWYNPWFEDIARGVDLDYHAVAATRTVSSPLLPDIVRHLAVDVDHIVALVDELVG